MTREEALKKIESEIRMYDEESLESVEWEECYDALADTVSCGVLEQVMWERDVAIEQLKELGYELGQKIEPCDDAISRQALLDTISELNAISFYEAQEDSKECYYEIRQAVENIPPVTPQQKSNLELICEELAAENDKLIEQLKQTQKYGKMLICPSCGLDVHSDFKCCPRCGNFMRGNNNGNE